MAIITLIHQYPFMWIGFITLISLCVGSFLNVVIYRLPKIIAGEPLGISFPLSHCPKCKEPLKYWHNIPVVSYCLLLGRCAYCKEGIPVRYFIVELLSAVGGFFIASHFGFSWQCLFGLIALWAMLTLLFLRTNKAS
jgi:leader peptidase (prepilin peptidase)/N-methyltransferase